MDTFLLIWLIVIAVMLVIEIFSLGLTTIWFSFGAVAAAIVAGLSGPLWLQVALFAVVSLVFMALVRPFAVRIVNKGRTKTNIEEVIGEKAVVIEKIDNRNEKGKVMFRGVEWTARSRDDVEIEVDETVTIQEVSGVKLIVSK